jgi:hypothetical protein
MKHLHESKKGRKMEAKYDKYCSLECSLFEQNRYTNAASTKKVKSQKL